MFLNPKKIMSIQPLFHPSPLYKRLRLDMVGQSVSCPVKKRDGEGTGVGFTDEEEEATA